MSNVTGLSRGLEPTNSGVWELRVELEATFTIDPTVALKIKAAYSLAKGLYALIDDKVCDIKELTRNCVNSSPPLVFSSKSRQE